MKLLLASNGGFLINQGYKLLSLPKEKIKIGYVTTASKGVEDLGYLDSHKNDMMVNSLNFEEIDIEDKAEKELREFFKDKNVIHVEGGNTFYLLKAVKETGFDKLIREFINRGKIYVGTSAGAYIACPTIETANWTKARDTFGLTNLTALSLVPFLLKVHYTDEMKDLLKEKIASCKYPVRILRDGQGILVENNNYKFVGEGEEIKL
ncbi:MAG: Type 1 glutamine amidotransferase-like domain-containing protein [Candidatus Liptonbacteria bacterium]|nr:Type 1 glutamine amidotransferase-like domain-containing protein [Candidatus Liptonbacteria bacterium]